MAHQLFELDIRLQDLEPPIWRTVLLPGSASLEDVHLAIQVAIGWKNSHLHHFMIGERFYGIAGLDAGPGAEDERRVRLQDVARAGTAFLYEYDFGDGWRHDVRVTRVTTAAKAPSPRCTAGARACPPEDCGGVPGYQQLLAVLGDPGHPEHAEARAWADDFEPEAFALPKAGRDLRRDLDQLRALANGADDAPDSVADATLEALTAIPRPLVDAVLALRPGQRAALIAIVAK